MTYDLRPTTCLLTLGHSNHPIEKFLAILGAHAVARVIDVRRFPASRKWPHFASKRLAASLASARIDYVGMTELGGRRRPRSDSAHIAWRLEAFRAYADFMDTAEFADALARATTAASEKRAALMCAEALPWKCHRSLIADALLARGIEVIDILSETQARPHRLPEFARVEGERVIYDGRSYPLPLGEGV
jgi:uncharacterized protein (DUF488 family)